MNEKTPTQRLRIAGVAVASLWIFFSPCKFLHISQPRRSVVARNREKKIVCSHCFSSFSQGLSEKASPSTATQFKRRYSIIFCKLVAHSSPCNACLTHTRAKVYFIWDFVVCRYATNENSASIFQTITRCSREQEKTSEVELKCHEILNSPNSHRVHSAKLKEIYYTCARL